MGIHCHLIQIPEWRVMQLDDEAIPNLFDEVGLALQPTRAEDGPRLPLADWRPEEPRRPAPALSLGKGWVELYLFLAGTDHGGPDAFEIAPPAARAIVGGRGAGKSFHGMDPARLLWADEVRRIAEALSDLSRDDLGRRFHDPKGYPPEVFKRIMWPFTTAIKHDTHGDAVFEAAARDLDHAFNALVGALDRLTAYYRSAAMRGNAMLIGFL